MFLKLKGGENRDRTGGLRLAKPALYQLSYFPKMLKRWSAREESNFRK